mgnify:CR=1 FL=1
MSITFLTYAFYDSPNGITYFHYFLFTDTLRHCSHWPFSCQTDTFSLNNFQSLFVQECLCNPAGGYIFKTPAARIIHSNDSGKYNATFFLSFINRNTRLISEPKAAPSAITSIFSSLCTFR